MTPSLEGGKTRTPNIVVFLVDDLGWKDLGCYGSSFYDTPHIDAFAKKAVRFTDAYAACHVCSPTRASVMTGKYPASLGLTDWLPGRKEFDFQRFLNVPTIQALPFAETTIAELLKSNGYRTGHFGKWHLGEEPSGPLAHGFDVQIPRWNKGWPRAGYHAPFKLEGLEDQDGDYLTDRLTDEALEFIEASRDIPFFLYLSHYAVHDPIHGRKDLVPKYEARRDTLPPSHTPFILEGNPDNSAPLSTEEFAKLSETSEADSEYRILPNQTVKVKQRQDNPEFGGMVESMDDSFGRVIAKLESLELSENTIVIFTSDNGGMAAANFGNPRRVINPERLDAAYSTSNLPLRGAKGWLYEGGIRVPMLIRWPAHSQDGSVSAAPVISADLFPTIVEMTNVVAPNDLSIDGISLAPLLEGKGSVDRDAIYWHFPHYSNHGMQSPGGAIRAGDYKLLEYFENGSVQLFNLRQDIGEQHDLSKQLPEKTKALKEMLHAWRVRIGAKMMQPNPNFVGSRPGGA